MAAGAVAGLAMVVGAIATALINDANQEKARKQNKQDIMDLSRQNQKIGQENWENTNAAAQREQIEKAGLSVGMMYSGKGGQPMGMTPQGNISRRDIGEVDLQAPIQAGLQGQQLDLQKKQQEANIKNTDADTQLKEIEAGQKTGVDLETKEATLEQIKQATENATVQKEIMTYESKMKEIEANIKTDTERDIVYQVKAEASKLMDEARTAYAKANIDQKTQDIQIKMIQQNAQEQVMRMAIMKQTGDKLVMDTAETQQKIHKIVAEVQKTMSETNYTDSKTRNEQRQLILNEIANDFTYGDTAAALRILKAAESIGSTVMRKPGKPSK